MQQGEDIFAEINEEESSDEDEDEAATPRKGGRPKAKWTAKEDRRFLVGLRKYGRGNWQEISDFVKTK